MSIVEALIELWRIRMNRTRAEHVRWCKERAMNELNFYGDNETGYKNAIISMMSDLRKHPETNNEVLASLCSMQLLSLSRLNRQTVINFINGFTE